MRWVLKQNFVMCTRRTKRLILVALMAFIVLAIPVSVAAQGNSPSYIPAAGSFCNYPKPTTHDLKDNPIIKCLNDAVGFLSAGVGVVVVGVIILGGIQYTMAGDNPQAVTAAKKRIIDGLIALVAFIFTFAFLQWIIPGGIFI